jgi:uncharacterized protein YbjT (DUF2867 family)
LCWFQDAEGLDEREFDAPLAGREAGLLLLEWLPPAEAAPLRLLPAPGAAFRPLWADDVGRALEDVREPDGRDERLLEVDCDDLWSRAVEAGRLKWGRAAAELLVVAAGRTAAARGAWLSVVCCEAAAAGSACETSASTRSGSSSSRS